MCSAEFLLSAQSSPSTAKVSGAVPHGGAILCGPGLRPVPGRNPDRPPGLGRRCSLIAKHQGPPFATIIEHPFVCLWKFPTARRQKARILEARSSDPGSYEEAASNHGHSSGSLHRG
jgi:hypothetical protein